MNIALNFANLAVDATYWVIDRLAALSRVRVTDIAATSALVDQESPEEPPPTPGAREPVGSAFALVFFGVFAIVLISGLATIAMAVMWNPPSALQQQTYDQIANGWKLGLPMILGLLGGKGLK